MIATLILIGTGGFAGAIARYAVGIWMTRRFASAFPYGTLAVNVSGSFLLGLSVGAGAPEKWNTFYQAFGIGFLGAFTTFSTYASESLHMLRQRQMKRFFVYQAASFLVAIAAAALGCFLGKLMQH